MTTRRPVSRRRNLLPLLGLLLGACGERTETAPSPDGAAGDPSRASGSGPAATADVAREPGAILSELAARAVPPPALDDDERRWLAALREGLLAGPRRDWRASVHSWTAAGPAPERVVLQRAELAPPPSARSPGDPAPPWVRLTRCARRPALLAEHERAHRTPLSSGGYWVRPFEGLGIPAFVSNLDDPTGTSYAWQHGELVVRTFGLDAAEVSDLHESLERARLYGDVPATPRPARVAVPDGKEPTDPARKPDAAAAGPSPRDDPRAWFAGRWSGDSAKSRLTIELRADGTFEGTEVRGQRSIGARGTWQVRDAGIELALTHEDGKPRPTPARLVGTRVGDALEVRAERSKEAALLRRR